MPTRNECMGWFAQIGCRLQYCTSPWATYCYKENLPVFAHPQMLQLISYWGLGKLGHTCGDWAGWNRLGNYRKWHVGRAIYTNCRLTAHGLFSGDSKWKCSWLMSFPTSHACVLGGHARKDTFFWGGEGDETENEGNRVHPIPSMHTRDQTKPQMCNKSIINKHLPT